eukprot:4249424-Pleurochrysis_carterae.AAC.2
MSRTPVLRTIIEKKFLVSEYIAHSLQWAGCNKQVCTHGIRAGPIRAGIDRAIAAASHAHRIALLTKKSTWRFLESVLISKFGLRALWLMNLLEQKCG